MLIDVKPTGHFAHLPAYSSCVDFIISKHKNSCNHGNQQCFIDIVGTYNNNIQIFDVESHSHVRSLAGHISTVSALLVSPSGRFLFSASYDKSIQVRTLDL